MKTAMSILAVALVVSPLLHAAEAPVRIGLEQVKNPYYPNLHQQRVHVQSLTDSVTINDVVVNRGNCPIQKIDLLPVDYYTPMLVLHPCGYDKCQLPLLAHSRH